tara:strand:- start:127 stop:528 length:402 start_codon:yes stop_codon:yes gene_type:complete
MKNLLLILALFVGTSFAEEEYPIELTCEFSTEILYVNVGKTAKDSWIKAHETSKAKSLNLHAIFQRDKFNKRLSPKSLGFEIGDKIIRLDFTNVAPMFLYINRLSGNAQVINFNVSMHGNCFKGFKEYNERKF